jgi:hypothetical protein
VRAIQQLTLTCSRLTKRRLSGKSSILFLFKLTVKLLENYLLYGNNVRQWHKGIADDNNK